MKTAQHGSLPKPIVRALGLTATMILTWCAAVVPARATTCFLAVNTIIDYYSSAAHTTLVGTCSQGPCPFTGCSGEKTSFFTAHNSISCEICP